MTFQFLESDPVCKNRIFEVGQNTLIQFFHNFQVCVSMLFILAWGLNHDTQKQEKGIYSMWKANALSEPPCGKDAMN